MLKNILSTSALALVLISSASAVRDQFKVEDSGKHVLRLGGLSKDQARRVDDSISLEIVVKNGTVAVFPSLLMNSLPKSISYHPTTVEFENAVASRMPGHFAGHATINREGIQAFRDLTKTAFRMFAQRSQAITEDDTFSLWMIGSLIGSLETMLTGPEGKILTSQSARMKTALVPTLTHMKSFFQNHFAGHESTPLFVKEIDEVLAEKPFDPIWFMILPLRQAAATSSLSEDESNILRNSPGSSWSLPFVNNSAWKSHLASLMVTGAHDEEVETSDVSRTMSVFDEEDKDPQVNVDSNISRFLDSAAIWPVMGEGKLGASYLVQCYLDRIFPVAFATPNDDNLSAHGVKFGRFGFSSHDYVHQELDLREDELEEHVKKKADQFLVDVTKLQASRLMGPHPVKSTGGSINGDSSLYDAQKALEGRSDVEPLAPEYSAAGFIKVYTPLAVEKFNLVNDALKEIYGHFLTRLLPQRGQAEFDKVMAGFVYFVHETFRLSSDSLDHNDISKAFDDIIPTSDDDDDNDLELNDPLKTSPVTGKSTLSDDEIYDYVIKNMTMKQARNGGDFRKDEKIQPWQIISKKINHGYPLIEVTFKLRDGQTLIFALNNMKGDIANAQDEIGLVEMAGMTVDRPQFDADEPYESMAAKTKKFLTEVNTKRNQVVRHFKEMAKKFAEMELGDQPSIASRFFDAHMKIGQKLRDAFPLVDVPATPYGDRMKKDDAVSSSSTVPAPAPIVDPDVEILETKIATTDKDIQKIENDLKWMGMNFISMFGILSQDEMYKRKEEIDHLKSLLNKQYELISEYRGALSEMRSSNS